MEEEKKSKKGLIITILVILLLIGGAFVGWYNYRFTVTIKYNNGLENTVEYIRFLGKIDESQIQEHFNKKGYSIKGFYETYIISSSDIEKLAVDLAASKNICRAGFDFNPNDNKCTAINQYNFGSERIVRDTTIEAIWSRDEEEVISGKEENAIITLSANKKCVIGNKDTIDITAKIKGYVSNKFVTWNLPKCYSAKRISDTHYILTRTNAECEESEELHGDVVVSLTNGSIYNLRIVYEPKLKIDVYGVDDVPVKEKNGAYKTKKATINTNVAAKFKSKNNTIKTTAQYRVVLNDNVNDTITIKTTCGQSKVVEIKK